MLNNNKVKNITPHRSYRGLFANIRKSKKTYLISDPLDNHRFSIPAAKVFYINVIMSTDSFSYLSRPLFKATSWHRANRVNNWESTHNAKAKLSRGSNSDNPQGKHHKVTSGLLLVVEAIKH